LDNAAGITETEEATSEMSRSQWPMAIKINQCPVALLLVSAHRITYEDKHPKSDKKQD